MLALRFAVIGALLVSYASTARAQLFDDGTPPGVYFTPITDTLVQDIKACSGMQGAMLAVAREGLVEAVGPGYFLGQPFTRQVADVDDFVEAYPGLSVGGISALASSPSLGTLYIGFVRNVAYNSAGGPILSWTAEQGVNALVTLDELLEVKDEEVSCQSLASGEEDRLYAVLGQSPDLALVSIEPGGAEGQRVERLLDTEELLSLLPGAHGLNDWGEMLAADSNGRVFFVAWPLVDVGGEVPVPGCVVVRRDPDGSITELTGREGAPLYPQSDMWFHLYPCYGMLNGMEWDPETNLLVGGGNGVWLIDPDEPQGFLPLAAPSQVQYLGMDTFGDGVEHNPSGVATNDGCFSRIEDGWYATMSYIFFALRFEPDFLDFDDDGLPGWRETLYGTDPRNADSDAGGMEDGREVLDFTDPLDGQDDRWYPTPAEDWSMSGDYNGSTFQTGLAADFSMNLQGVAMPDGTLRVATTSGSTPSNLYVFEGWDEPAMMTDVPGTHYAMASDLAGNLYGISTTIEPGSIAAVRLKEGAEERLFALQLEQAFVDAEPEPTAVAADALGRVWVGYKGGVILRSASDGAPELVYDARPDLESTAWLDEDGSCGGGACWCSQTIRGLAFDPVRAMMYFGLNRHFNCPGGSGESPVIAAVHPDGKMSIIANLTAVKETCGQDGAGEIADIEPDMTGGLWLLFTHGIERSLARLDANYESREFRYLKSAKGDWLATSLLAHATDLMVTPEGRVYTVGATYYNEYPTHYGLVEIAPLSAGIETGDLVMVHGEDVRVSRLTPAGAGEVIWQGEPLEAPGQVAATEEKLVVSDMDADGVWVFPVDSQGQVGAPELQGNLDFPAGLDIDRDGNIIVAVPLENRLVRITPDGQQEEFYAGEGLAAPIDVLITDSGVAVANSEDGSLVFIDDQGGMSILTAQDALSHIALASGNPYALCSRNSGSPPEWFNPVNGSTKSAVLSSLFSGSVDDTPLGVAVDPDGVLYWYVSLGYTMPQDSLWSEGSYLFRVSAEGHFKSLTRYHVGGITERGGLARVRGKDEGLPVKPGDPVPVLVEGDVLSGDVGGSGNGGGGSCSQETRGSGYQLGLWILLLSLVGLMLVRRARGMSGFLLVLGFGGFVAGCGSSSSKSSSDAEVVQKADANVPDLGSWDPEQVPSYCLDKASCPPGAGPFCEGEKGWKRCTMDEDGCWVWASAACADGETCQDGLCKQCLPDCQGKTCGSDGCGSNCGQCESPDVCCAGYFCGKCVANCQGKVCGHDGAGGTCGECAQEQVCDRGQCRSAGQGLCSDWFGCQGFCEPWNDWCWDQCLALPGAQGRGLATALGACMANSCSYCNYLPGEEECLTSCLVDNCLVEYANCHGQGGTLTCKEVFLCTAGCEPADEPCGTACFSQGTQMDLYLALAWQACALELCDETAPTMELESCLKDAALGECQKSFSDCFGDCSMDCGDQECGLDECTFLCGMCADGEECVEGQCL